MLRKVFVVLVVTAFSFNAVAEEDESVCVDPSCLILDQIDQELAQEPVNLTLVQWLIQELFVVLTTQEPAILPYWTYPEGSETDYLLLTAENQFGEGLTDYITPTMLQNVWNAIYDKFEIEIDTYRSGMSSSTQMANYLFAFNLNHWSHIFKSTVKNKMAAYTVPVLPAASPVNNPPLPSAVSYPEDFQGADAKIVQWPRFSPKTWDDMGRLIKGFSDDGLRIYVLVGNEIWARSAMYFLQYKTGMALSQIMDDVLFIYRESDWINAGDWSPYFVWNGTELIAMCPNSGVPWGPTLNDNANCIGLGGHFGLPTYQVMYTDASNEDHEFHLEGSNFITNGNGTAIVSSSVFTFNPGLDLAILEATLSHYLGIEEVIILSELGESSSAGHVNEFVAMVGNTAIVSETYFYMKAELDSVAAQLADAGFDVMRIPLSIKTETDLTGITLKSYTNAAIAGGTVFMPTFGDFWHPWASSQDNAAEAVYQSLGLDVVKVEWKIQKASMIGYSSSNVPTGAMGQIE